MSGFAVQAVAALLVVAALVYARRQLTLRVAGRPPVLEVLERRMLGRESGVAVVRWCGEEVLVGFGASGITPLHPPAGFDAASSRQSPGAEDRP